MKTNYNKPENMNKKPNNEILESANEVVIENEETTAAENISSDIFEYVGWVKDDVSLNLRKGPSLSADILSTLNGGTEVSILPEQSTDRFYKVRTSFGVEGYCMRDYIKLT